MSTKIASVRLEKDDIKNLNEMSKRRDRSVNYLISQAVKKMLSDEERLKLTVEKGLAELDVGKGIPHSEVVKRTNRLIASAARKAAK
jgi:predicted transcriptional regulator